ncbi:hypothetical protein [Streptomyces longispororuber]|uniref:hypothetical protein n=1 Tax=Streptomyces longispororuber TaxID=68230 RepID=UPI00210CBB02|nr:hypothetical protein [Streptomyces longispororuber]MCQ4210507.1 hypothetical protein [Streptomyces longispororuber]
MDPIVLSAGTALVGAIASDTWEGVRAAIVALWRRARPEQADAIDEELVASRRLLLAARDERDTEVERTLVSDWQIRLQSLLRHDPSAGAELRALLAGELTPPGSSPYGVGMQSLRAEASDNGRVYQAGRDQHITGG